MASSARNTSSARTMSSARTASSATNMSFQPTQPYIPIYQIEFSATEELSYRRIHWRFGFTNLHALKAGNTGFACRGVEHEITVEWSVMSGDRRIILDGIEVYTSEKNWNATLEYSWDMAGHEMKIYGHVLNLGAASPLRQNDLLVNGLSYFSALGLPLFGMVFFRDDKGVGQQSIHFDNEIGCYVSFEHEDYDDETFDDGTSLPYRLYFSDQTLDFEERKFTGRLDYGGTSWDGFISEKYEFIFDTQFVCILSGEAVRINCNGTLDAQYTVFGEDVYYTNTNHDKGNVDIVNVDTVQRLMDEGATKKTIRPYHDLVRKAWDEKIAAQKLDYETYGNTFGEMTDGYFFTSKWKVDNATGKYKMVKEYTEWVDMSRPRISSYKKWNDSTQGNVTLNLIVPSSSHFVPDVEFRAITLRQLRAVAANVNRRCIEEVWKNRNGKILTPETVSMYDVHKYVVVPFTKAARQSFVSCLPSTGGPQPPRFFASHWWGDSLLDFMKCLEQLVRDFAINGYRDHEDVDDGSSDSRRGGGLTPDTPIWICLFANNQWQVEDDITVDPKQSGFFKALELAEGRTVTILDKGGVIFTRISCLYELFLSVAKDKNMVYTAHPHTYRCDSKKEEREASGIIIGGAPADGGNSMRTLRREQHFPFKLIKKSLCMRVETAEASEETDKEQILNSITANAVDGIDDDRTHSNEKKFDDVNDSIRAAFASTLRNLQAASKESDNVWSAFLVALSRGKKKLEMSFDFDNHGWREMTAERACALIMHLPLTAAKLKIKNANFGQGVVNAVIEHIYQSRKLDDLWLRRVSISGDGLHGEDAGVRMADAIAVNTSLIKLRLEHTDVLCRSNVEEWGDALLANKTLKSLVLRGVEEYVIIKLKRATIHRRPKLGIYSTYLVL